MEPSSSDGDQILTEPERWWRDRQPWLKENGYVLRSRYTPGWVPSWKDKKGIVFPEDYEDGAVAISLQIMDATAGAEHVCLKQVNLRRAPQEPIIMQKFSSSPLADDPTNHCVPLKATLIAPDSDSQTALLVLPILRSWVSPSIDTIGEAVDFIRQLLEGVNFMHKHGVAHRDIKDDNVMMDASGMYPNGFHFADPDRTLDFKSRAKHFSRTEKPPKYYLIDFGHAKEYDLSNGPPLDLPFPGGDYTVPENQPDKHNIPCDPFKVDVYCTGNILRWYFTEGHRDESSVLYYPKAGFEFLKPLVDDMVQEDPSKRPTMPEVVERFEDIRKGLSAFKLRSRVAEKREWLIVSLVRGVHHWARTAQYIIRRLPATPVA